MLSWSSGGVNGPLEIDLVSATSGNIIVVDTSIDLSSGSTTYKWIVAALPDTYYMQGNSQDFPNLIYSGNFTISKGTTACINKQAVESVGGMASGSAVKQSATASISPPSTIVSGAGRAIISGFSIVTSLVVFAGFFF